MEATNKINAYILCGGKSSRMKTEKGLVRYKGKTFVEHIIAALSPFASETRLVTANKDYEHLGYECIKDIYPEKGPLGGIFTALSHTTSASNFIMSCDIPCINQELIKTLIQEHYENAFEISYLADNSHDFPLVGIYEKRLSEKLKTSLLQNQLRVRSFVQDQKAQKITVDSEEAHALKNINTPEELARLT